MESVSLRAPYHSIGPRPFFALAPASGIVAKTNAFFAGLRFGFGFADGATPLPYRFSGACSTADDNYYRLEGQAGSWLSV